MVLVRLPLFECLHSNWHSFDCWLTNACLYSCMKPLYSLYTHTHTHTHTNTLFDSPISLGSHNTYQIQPTQHQQQLNAAPYSGNEWSHRRPITQQANLTAAYKNTDEKLVNLDRIVANSGWQAVHMQHMMQKRHKILLTVKWLAQVWMLSVLHCSFSLITTSWDSMNQYYD